MLEEGGRQRKGRPLLAIKERVATGPDTACQHSSSPYLSAPSRLQTATFGLQRWDGDEEEGREPRRAISLVECWAESSAFEAEMTQQNPAEPEVNGGGSRRHAFPPRAVERVCNTIKVQTETAMRRASPLTLAKKFRIHWRCGKGASQPK